MSKSKKEQSRSTKRETLQGENNLKKNYDGKRKSKQGCYGKKRGKKKEEFDHDSYDYSSHRLSKSAALPNNISEKDSKNLILQSFRDFDNEDSRVITTPPIKIDNKPVVRFERHSITSKVSSDSLGKLSNKQVPKLTQRKADDINHVSVSKGSIRHADSMCSNTERIPVLERNKTYNIAFAMKNDDAVRKDIKTVESNENNFEEVSKKSVHEFGRTKGNYENILSTLMKDVSIVERNDVVDGKERKGNMAFQKGEYRREISAEGDVSYIDVATGNILKIEKAEWKTGVEIIRNKSGSKNITFEWRKSLVSDEWIKYNTETNEILKRGDWRSGSEWYRNSLGKLVERSYSYVQSSNGKWIKSDLMSGMAIGYSNSSVLKGHNWIRCDRGASGTKGLIEWRKQDYEYVQNKKGQWIKQDPITKKMLEKPSKSGWKEGICYTMNQNGKVTKVKYVLETQNDGVLRLVDKKTKRPINVSWMKGQEVVIEDNRVVTNNYCWVECGKNKLIKIDVDTGRALTKPMKLNKLPMYNKIETKERQADLQTSRGMENNVVLDENVKG